MKVFQPRKRYVSAEVYREIFVYNIYLISVV